MLAFPGVHEAILNPKSQSLVDTALAFPLSLSISVLAIAIHMDAQFDIFIRVYHLHPLLNRFVPYGT